MLNVIKQEVRMEESLRKRLEFICEFCRVKPIIINGNLRTIDKTNLTYLEPHRIIINDITFLKSKIDDLKDTLKYWKDKFEKLISFLHRNFIVGMIKMINTLMLLMKCMMTMF